MQILGEIEQRVPAVGMKMWCLYVFLIFLSRSEAGALFIRGLHSLNMFCVTVNGLILMRFSTFFQKRVISDALHSSHDRH